MIIDRLIDKIKETENPTCVGIDTDFSYLPENMQNVSSVEEAASSILEFNQNIIDNIKDIVPAIKVQVAYYEQLGHAGLKVFKETLDYGKKSGLFTIADVKRNDIGATASAYAKAYFGGVTLNGKKFPAAFDADFITVNGYLGSDGLDPFIQDAIENDRGIFSLVKTSNPSSGQLQDLKYENGKTLFEEMASLLSRLGSSTVGTYGFSRVGGVVGATYKEQGEKIRKENENMFFLIPGYGVQGGKAENLRACFREDGLGGIVNNSRGILCACRNADLGEKNYAKAARLAAANMQQDLARILK